MWFQTKPDQMFSVSENVVSVWLHMKWLFPLFLRQISWICRYSGKLDTNQRYHSTPAYFPACPVSYPETNFVAACNWRFVQDYRTCLRCTALKLKAEFCAALLMNAKEFMKFSKGEAETRKAIEAFHEISCFPQVVSAIDGSHIPIIAPK